MKWFKCDYFMVLMEQVIYVSKGELDNHPTLFVYLKDGHIKQTLYEDSKKMAKDYDSLVSSWSGDGPTYQCDVFTVSLGAIVNIGRTIESEGKQGTPALYLDFLGGRSSQTNFESYERLGGIFKSLVEVLEKNSDSHLKLVD